MPSNDKEVLGIIPAREGSKGIPGKNIRQLGGKPLVVYSIEAASASRLLSRTLVSTDSEAIADVCRKYQIEIPFLRPKNLAGDQSPAIEYIAHCLDFLQREQEYRPDAIVLLQPTSPFRTGADIDACIRLLLDNPVDSVVSVSQLPGKYHPSWQFQIDAEGRLAPWQEWSAMPSTRQALPATYVRNGAVYAFWRESFEAFGNIYGESTLAYIMPPERSINIDDTDDWIQAKKVIQQQTREDQIDERQ